MDRARLFGRTATAPCTPHLNHYYCTRTTVWSEPHGYGTVRYGTYLGGSWLFACWGGASTPSGPPGREPRVCARGSSGTDATFPDRSRSCSAPSTPASPAYDNKDKKESHKKRRSKVDRVRLVASSSLFASVSTILIEASCCFGSHNYHTSEWSGLPLPEGSIAVWAVCSVSVVSVSPAPSDGTYTTGESGSCTPAPCTVAPCSCAVLPQFEHGRTDARREGGAVE